MLKNNSWSTGVHNGLELFLFVHALIEDDIAPGAIPFVSSQINWKDTPRSSPLFVRSPEQDSPFHFWGLPGGYTELCDHTCHIACSHCQSEVHFHCSLSLVPLDRPFIGIELPRGSAFGKHRPSFFVLYLLLSFLVCDQKGMDIRVWSSNCSWSWSTKSSKLGSCSSPTS